MTATGASARSVGDVRWTCAAAGMAIGVLLMTMLAGGRPDAPVRHLYLVPVLAVGVRWGFGPGVFAGALAALLHGPFVLSAMEDNGLDGAASEGLVTLALLVGGGAFGGALAGAARRERERHRLLRALQRVLAADQPIDLVLVRLANELAARLRADVAIVLLEGGARRHAGAPDLVAMPAIDTVLASGTGVFVPDIAHVGCVRRVTVSPVTVGDEVRGALAVARAGEIGAGERASFAALAAAIGLGLENARLVACQRRFTEELAEKVASARRELAAIDRAKSAFVATASHELRTPLTALRGFSELLVTRRFPPEEVRRLASIIERETERLGRLVEDLLDLSRLEQGLEPPLRRSVIDARAALETSVLVFRAVDRHRVVVECEADVDAVDADPDALDRIVKNLVSNAIKYSPPGTVRVVARKTRGAVEVSVVDGGAGIPPEARARLFEPYFRVPETARVERGTGIGLAVVKALVEAHGGTIDVENRPQGGARFFFTLPSPPSSRAHNTAHVHE